MMSTLPTCGGKSIEKSGFGIFGLAAGSIASGALPLKWPLHMSLRAPSRFSNHSMVFSSFRFSFQPKMGTEIYSSGSYQSVFERAPRVTRIPVAHDWGAAPVALAALAQALAEVAQALLALVVALAAAHRRLKSHSFPRLPFQPACCLMSFSFSFLPLCLKLFRFRFFTNQPFILSLSLSLSLTVSSFCSV